MSLILHRLDHMPPPKPRDEVVTGLLAAGEICILSGSPGCGKSAVAATLAGAIAEGDQFLGLSTEQGCVVYLALEKSALAFRRLAATGCRQDRIVVGEGALSLRDRNAVDLLINSLKAIECKLPETLALIIIDTLGRAMSNMDENSSGDAGLAVAELERIGRAFPGAALLVVHHTGKGEHQSLRGSSALLAGADVELTVEVKRGRRVLRVRKANAIADGLGFPFNLFSISAPDGVVVLAQQDVGSPPSEAGDPSPSSAAQRLLELIDDGRMARRGLQSRAEKTGLLGPTVASYGDRFRRVLKDAKAAGVLDYDRNDVWLLGAN